MNAIFLLRVIACVCWFFAAFGGPFEPFRPYSGSVGWMGLFFFGLSFLITG